MAGPGNPKTGGRKRGTPNKTTARVRQFFGECLELAFADPAFKLKLVESITKFELDPRTLQMIVNQAAGMPSRQVDVNVRNIPLENIVAGVPLEDYAGDDDDEGEDDGGS